MGLIPARAGKTVPSAPGRRRCRAHPRSRGENTSRSRRGGSSLGSSPLARGKLALPLEVERRARLIPARAGKTRLSSLSGLPVAAHPRSRGENRRGASPRSFIAGSSPLARGKHARATVKSSPTRLIPARAGKTRGRSKTPSRKPAHPRSRGENGPGRVGAAGGRGSSPLARGKRQTGSSARAGSRLIPARAGKTSGTRCGA